MKAMLYFMLALALVRCCHSKFQLKCAFNAAQRSACVLLASNMMVAPMTAIMLSSTVSYAAEGGAVVVNTASASPQETEVEDKSASVYSFPSSASVARTPKNYKRRSAEGAVSESQMQKNLDRSIEKIVTLKAYLDEAESNVFSRKWDRLLPYLYTISGQDGDFGLLIQQLFPNSDALDASAREALAFEARSIFLNLDNLKEAAKDKDYDYAEAVYSKLLLSYDRFLKAGGLYDTYDEITSTEVLYKNAPLETWRYDARSKVGVQDKVILLTGPDMGKTGYVIHLEGDNAVIKLDKNGRNYQEVKLVKYKAIARTSLE